MQQSASSLEVSLRRYRRLTSISTRFHRLLGTLQKPEFEFHTLQAGPGLGHTPERELRYMYIICRR